MAKKVLIIDDDAEFTDAISNLLDAKGYQAYIAADGKSGLQKAEQEKPDIILLDVMMATKQEGFDVAKSLHENQELKKIPVIMISGIRKEMNLPFGFEPDGDYLPVNEMLEKPVKPEVLLAAIEKNIA